MNKKKRYLLNSIPDGSFVALWAPQDDEEFPVILGLTWDDATFIVHF